MATKGGRSPGRRKAWSSSSSHKNDSVQEGRSLLRQSGCVLWLTGPSGSGKSMIANTLQKELNAHRHLALVLDGDAVRKGLNCDLGFSPEDRRENVRRVAEVAALLADAGLIAITALISPYQVDRDQARHRIGPHRYLEIYLDVPVDVCRRRDPKGLYAQAMEGKIAQFTGVSAPYEPPRNAELTLPTHELTLDACVARILVELDERKLVWT